MRALVLTAVLVAGCQPASVAPTASGPLPADRGLKSVADFAAIESESDRSVALFHEAAKVIQHPRCVNCHPAGDRPLQRNGEPHQPLALRGEEAHGAPGMGCDTCHGESSYLNMPGSPNWHLAPREMAWQGRSVADICAQIKDEKRNGGMSLAAVAHHMENDPLVSYGWRPPRQLDPVPGNQPLFVELVRAWIDTGAACPASAAESDADQ